MSTETQQILGEMRAMRSEFDELSLQIRIDTTWIRVKENIRYALNVIKEIPIFARVCLLVGCVLLTIPLMVGVSKEIKRKLSMFALDCFSLALVVVSI